MSTEEVKKITDLPILVLQVIFENLSIEDLFTCRLVNKKFKEFSDHTNGINKLIIGRPNGEFYHDDNYWHHNNKLIEDKDKITLKCFRTIQKLSIFNLDQNLKYLKIYDQRFELEELSNLINLQSIDFRSDFSSNNQKILNLNNLKILILKRSIVQLNTPKLEQIQFEDINQINLVSNPDTIKHLITWNYDNKLEIFKNLEILELKITNQPLNENLLSLFKNLKQLKINLGYYNVGERFKSSLIAILNDKIKLKRSIDIYCAGGKIENIDEFNELSSKFKSTFNKFFNLF